MFLLYMILKNLSTELHCSGAAQPPYHGRRIGSVSRSGGNHADSGQICIGNTDDSDLMRQFIDGRDGKYAYLPKEGLLFPALLELEPPSERPLPVPGASCAALVDAGLPALAYQ